MHIFFGKFVLSLFLTDVDENYLYTGLYKDVPAMDGPVSFVPEMDEERFQH